MDLIDKYCFSSSFLTVGQIPELNMGSILFFALMIMSVGLISIIYPQLFWHLRVGRKIPNVPPNKLYLMVLRFGGLLVMILGLVMIIHVL